MQMFVLSYLRYLPCPDPVQHIVFHQAPPPSTYALSLHDALPISCEWPQPHPGDHSLPSRHRRERQPHRLRRRPRSEEHTSELQSRENLVCRLLLEKKKIIQIKKPFVAHVSASNRSDQVEHILSAI